MGDEMGEDGNGVTEEQKKEIKEWNEKIVLTKLKNRLKKANNKPSLPKNRKVSGSSQDFANHLENLGIDPSGLLENINKRSKSRGRKRERSSDKMEDEETRTVSKKTRDAKSMTRKGRGISDPRKLILAENKEKAVRKSQARQAKKGPGDNHIPTERPKHLFSGKRRQGTHYHR